MYHCSWICWPITLYSLFLWSIYTHKINPCCFGLVWTHWWGDILNCWRFIAWNVAENGLWVFWVFSDIALVLVFFHTWIKFIEFNEGKQGEKEKLGRNKKCNWKIYIIIFNSGWNQSLVVDCWLLVVGRRSLSSWGLRYT